MAFRALTGLREIKTKKILQLFDTAKRDIDWVSSVVTESDKNKLNDNFRLLELRLAAVPFYKGMALLDCATGFCRRHYGSRKRRNGGSRINNYRGTSIS